MKLNIKIHLVLLLVLIAVSPWAQDNQGISIENQLHFYTDFAGFRDFKDETRTYQEIYISFPNFQLSYIEKEKAYLAAYHISILIKDSTDKQIAQKEWQNFNQIDHLKQAESLISLEIAGFLITPGVYIISIKLTDLNSQAVGFADKPMRVAAFEQNKLQISEIEFARSIQRIQTRNKFVKNNIEVLPNPSRVFGIESPFLYFYTEIYNLNQSDKQGKIKREFSIIDARGNIVKLSEKIVQPKSTSSIWVEKVNVLDVVSGKYILKLRAVEETTGNIAEREAELWINNPYKTISLAQYDDNDIEEFRAQIEYLVDSKELNFFDKLNIQGKIQYINDFWRNKSSEFRTEHLKRFYSAQERFASPTLPGWKSDRGRVFIMYGPADEIVREPSSIDTKAYEIWIYETLRKQGQVQFVFVDLGIAGNYSLVHSTLKSGERAEIYNPNWIDDIKIAR